MESVLEVVTCAVFPGTMLSHSSDLLVKSGEQEPSCRSGERREWILAYLTEAFYIDQNEEYGQKRKCPLLNPYSEPLWGGWSRAVWNI